MNNTKQPVLEAFNNTRRITRLLRDLDALTKRVAVLEGKQLFSCRFMYCENKVLREGDACKDCFEGEHT